MKILVSRNPFLQISNETLKPDRDDSENRKTFEKRENP
jgi:hypothetical protein